MSEIKIGEYVRTREGYLGKLIAINEQDYNYLVVDTTREIRSDEYPATYLYLKNEDIVKHSKNIIDLIEVGDIIEVQTGLYNKYKTIIQDEDTLISMQESLKKFLTIKVIVTHQQFEQIKYIVEENNKSSKTNR